MMTGLGAFDASVKFSLGRHSFEWPSPVAIAPVFPDCDVVLLMSVMIYCVAGGRTG